MRSARPGNQGGYILLAILAIVFSVSAYLLVTAFSPVSLRLAQERRTAETLAQTRAALIGYAMAYNDNQVPGYLPCPDGDESVGEGSATANVGSSQCGSTGVSRIGRLPWRTIGVPPLQDGSGACLWYAVSGNYKNSSPTKNKFMNWDSLGQFDVLEYDGVTKRMGTTADTRAVALVYAPGAAVLRSGTLQDRTDRRADPKSMACGGNYTAANYLDRVIALTNEPIDNAVVASPLSRAIADGPAANFNDRIAFFITQRDVWTAYQKRFATAEKSFRATGTPEHPLRRLTRLVAGCVRQYGIDHASHLPFAALAALTDYGDKTKYTQQEDLRAGRLPDVASGCLAGDDLDLWEAWKDHFFYAVAERFDPDSDDAGPGCSASDCVAVGTVRFAAVVFFAGPRVGSQSRVGASRGDVTNYLDGINPAGFPNASGNSSYENPVPDAGFNDILYCIRDTLATPEPCP